MARALRACMGSWCMQEKWYQVHSLDFTTYCICFIGPYCGLYKRRSAFIAGISSIEQISNCQIWNWSIYNNFSWLAAGFHKLHTKSGNFYLPENCQTWQFHSSAIIVLQLLAAWLAYCSFCTEFYLIQKLSKLKFPNSMFLLPQQVVLQIWKYCILTHIVLIVDTEVD